MLKGIIGDEVLLWKARAKQHWLKKGDGNTRFFHAMANERARTNHIGVIKDDGTRLDREQDKRNYFYTKFKARFDQASTASDPRGDWSDLFGDRAFLSSNNLTLPFTEDEIRKAVF